MNAGDINVKIKGDNSDLAHALHDGLLKMRQAKREAKQINLGKELFGGLSTGNVLSKGLGLLGVGGGIFATLASIKGATSGARDLEELSVKLNETIENIAKVKGVAKATRSDVNDLGLSFLRLERTLGEPGSEKAAEALEHLGLSASDLTRMTLPEKMIALNEAFQRARSEGTGVADIGALIGKGFQNLLPVLTMSTDKLKELLNTKPDGAMLTHLAELDKRIDSLFNRIAKAGKIAFGALGLGLEAALYGGADILTFGAFGLGKKWSDNQKKEKSDHLAENKKIAADKQHAADAMEAEAQARAAAAEQEAAEKKAEALQKAGEKLWQDRHEMLPDDAKMQEDIDNLQSIFNFMKSINQEASEEGVMKWAESLRLAGDLDGLENALNIIEQMKKAKGELEHMEKAQHQRQAHVGGETLGALNVLTGHQDSLVVDEAKRTNQLLDLINRGIEQINGKDKSSGVGFKASSNFFDLSK
jgi:hypothetical protein